MEGSNKNGRVTRYSLEYSLNGKDWENIIPKNGFKGKFKGNLVPGRSRANFSRHRVMKHLRVIPLKSYGDYPCLKIEPFGCTFTCGEVLTSDYGKISGNSRVDIDQNCLWRIEVLNTSALSFDFTIFDILCEHGYLNIRDGYFDFIDSPVIERLCLKNRDQDFNHLLKINTNKVWLNFVSNSSDYEDGFTLKYFGECKQTINLIEGKPNKINSPNFPNEYFGNMDCMWIINAAPGVNSIDIIFNDFSIESTSKSCLDDTLTINYYENEQENLLGVFCNDNIPKMNYSLLADRVSIHFKTDSISSDRGFSILIQSGKKLPPTERNMIPENPTSSIETTLTSESTFNNDTFGTPRKDKKEDSGSDWTIITISAFSAIVVLLLIWVIGNNLRRFINNRNEVEAHCAKVKAKNEEKILQEQKRASQAERYSLIQSPKHDIVMVSPKHKFSPSPVKTMSPSKMTEDINDEELHDSVDGELSHLMSTPEHNSTISKHDTVSPVSGTHSLNSPAEAEVDLPKGYNGSVQVQSPSKLNSTSDVSFKEGNNNSDIESCV
uniref:Uncharacterized protein n=2 Tax=Clytia hemisphaerica TaxID=252671 RepID=A0A7M5XGZ4_9CNID